MLAEKYMSAAAAIAAAGTELGGSVLYPATSIEKDFAWSPDPIADACRAYKTMPDDAPTSGSHAYLKRVSGGMIYWIHFTYRQARD